MLFARLYIGVDRQDDMINGSDADDRRNIIFHAVGSAENTTGYVLGLHLNVDPSLNPDDIERDAIASGEKKRGERGSHRESWQKENCCHMKI
jgi:hypothetical protein